MKRIIILFTVLIGILILCTVQCQAADIDVFDDDIKTLEDQVDDHTKESLSQLGGSSVEQILTSGVDSTSILNYLIDQLAKESKSPLAALAIMIPIMILSSVAESYTYSLRYTDTRDIMGIAVSLFIASTVISPITELIASSVNVMKGACTLMSVYLPVMAGMLMFSGHTISSGGYYAAVTIASQMIGKITTNFLTPLLNVFLSLSVCSGICSVIRLNGLIETVSKVFRYTITFIMSLFIAVLSLNSTLSGAADNVANRAAKFGLSSFIPLIGASISEAYGALQNGVSILRSGVGVFVILAVFAAFAPVLLRIFLWSAAVFVSKSVGETLSAHSAHHVLNALSQFLSALRVTVIAVMTVFIISSSLMMRLGGAS